MSFLGNHGNDKRWIIRVKAIFYNRNENRTENWSHKFMLKYFFPTVLIVSVTRKKTKKALFYIKISNYRQKNVYCTSFPLENSVYNSLCMQLSEFFCFQPKNFKIHIFWRRYLFDFSGTLDLGKIKKHEATLFFYVENLKKNLYLDAVL